MRVREYCRFETCHRVTRQACASECLLPLLPDDDGDPLSAQKWRVRFLESHSVGKTQSIAHVTDHLSSNSFLENRGVKVPKATSTGTTIVGCIYKDGIVLGADTRATEGEIVADKNCEKVRVCIVRILVVIDTSQLQIHYITDNIRCCGAGTAADTEFTTALIASNSEEMDSGWVNTTQYESRANVTLVPKRSRR